MRPMFFIMFLIIMALKIPAVQATQVEVLFERFETGMSEILSSRKGSYEDANRVEALYNKIFASIYEADLSSFSVADLNLLFRASDQAAFYVKKKLYVEHMESVFVVLDKRNAVQKQHYQRLHQKNLLVRNFDRARQINSYHSAESVPKVKELSGQTVNPTTLHMWSDLNKLVEEEHSVTQGQWLIIIANPFACRFSYSAYQALSEDTLITNSSSFNVLWVVPQSNISWHRYRNWNAESAVPLRLVYDMHEWASFFNFSEVPSFYFVKEGSLVYQFSGWPDEGARKQLRTGLDHLVTTEIYQQ